MRTIKHFYKAAYSKIIEDEGGHSLAYLTIIVLCAALILGAVTFYHGFKEAEKAKGRLATIEEVAMMRYHGIETAEVHPGGDLSFYRDGKKIRVRM